jgi:phosphatidylserine/phosphatidylglycerophosphate/cardiolipin synthase-like enzyme
VALLGSAKRTLDICVFTITDDRISGAVLAAHRRGVKVRIVTDDEKADDLGSDIAEFKKAGLAVRTDNSTFHMHHKFALVDGALLLNGSFNWTRSASMNNQENFVITGDARLIGAFAKEFERLWNQFGRP